MKSKPDGPCAGGFAPEFLHALDKRALADGGFTCDQVETRWLFVGRALFVLLDAAQVPDAADQPGHVNDGQPRRLGKMVDRHVGALSQQKTAVLQRAPFNLKEFNA